MDDRARALLAIGLLLLSVPIWAPYLDVTGPDYSYEHAPITVENGEISVDAPVLHARAPSHQIDCFGVFAAEEERLCRFDQALLQDNLTVDPTAGVSGGLRPSGADFVVFRTSGPVYERSFARLEEGGYELGLQRVDPESALDQVAWNLEHQPDLRRVIENDRIQTDDRIFPHQSVIVESGSSYHLVYEAGRNQFLSPKPGVERGIEALLMAIGAYLVFGAGRQVGRQG